MAVTLTYLYPTPGSIPAVPNTISNMVVATVQGSAVGDLSVSITHGFGLTSQQRVSGFPRITVVADASEVNSVFEISEGSNHSVLGLPGVIGPVKVFIEVPQSITA